MKLHIIAFGCQMSVADSEEMTRALSRRGYIPVPDPEDADAILLNTCTVRQHAEDRAVSLIGRLKTWKELRPGRLLIVAGCAAERIAPWLRRRFPYIDLVAGARSIEQFPALLEEALTTRRLRPSGNDEPPHDERSSAYVTIMRGCNYRCSYCIVPAVRGRETSRPFAAVLQEVRERAAEGALEITLLGQTVNAYRSADGRDFADLLRALGALPGVERIRFISPHPYYLTAALTNAMADTPQVCPHLHLPAQSGSDRILERMCRSYTRRLFLERITAIRRRVPDLALSTDLIVGFPGESETDFAATLSLLDEADFCAAYCYKFSPRPGTAAAGFADRIPPELQEERLARLLARTDRMTRRHLDHLLHRRVQVLLSDTTDGRTQYHFKARLNAPRRAGTLVDAVVIGATRTALKCAPANACDHSAIHDTV
ncbi:MAG: tRNA (N6-isopentenyl adenosine(37)-C2)-methylthiotransferase MiaB [Elusimicrobiota bacterium]